jgi:hypothetical protein
MRIARRCFVIRGREIGNWLISHIGSAATFWGLGVGGMVASAALIVTWLIRSGLRAAEAEPRRHPDQRRLAS